VYLARINKVVDLEACRYALFGVWVSWLFEDEGRAGIGRRAAKERGQKREYEEEEEGKEIGERGGEGRLGLATGRLSGARSSAGCTATELVDANTGAASEVEDEAGACVKAA
jgi:hypothetical protein